MTAYTPSETSVATGFPVAVGRLVGISLLFFLSMIFASEEEDASGIVG